jgi:hypothetical protein
MGPAAARSRWGAFAVGQLLALALTASLAYLDAFSFFTNYDDEGCLMLLVRHVLDGHRLYDDVWTIYGPVYYLFKELLHGPLGLPLTHDVVRLTASALRLLAAVLSSAAVFALTRRVWLGVVTQVLVTIQLWPVVREPGHPQELIAVGIAAVALLLALAEGRRRWLLVAAGAAAGAVAMIKVNIGVFTVAAVWMTLLATVRRTSAVIVLGVASIAGVIALPWLLMRAHLEVWWGIAFARLVTTAIVGVALVSLRDEAAEGSFGDLAAGFAGMAAGVLVPTLLVLAQGTSLAALADGLFLGAQRFIGLFVVAPPMLFRGAAEIGDAAVVLALACAVVGSSRLRDRHVPTGIVALGRLVFGALVVRATWQKDVVSALNAHLPFAWIVLLPVPGEMPPNDGRLGRAAIAWLAALEPLQAYPVAGSQKFFGLLPLVLCGVLALGDGLAGVRALLPLAERAGLRTAATAVATAALAYGTWGQVAQLRVRYESGVALALPGAARMHVGPPDAAYVRGLVQALQAQCETFITYAGFNSLYFWTGERPPTLDVVSHVMTLPPERRERMVRALLAHPRACVVLHRGLVPLDAEFVERIRRDFRVQSAIRDFTLLVPKDDAGRGGAPAGPPG